MDAKKNRALYGLPDRFVAVEIETEATPAFDAAQYSFFGDLSAADSGLEGALEDGLEAPPPEEGLGGQEYVLHGGEDDVLHVDEEDDLSVAALFRNQLGLGPVKAPGKREDPDDDAGLDALLTDPLSVARKQLQDEEYDHRGLPAELYPEPSSHTAANSQSQSLFSAQQPSYGLFGPYSQPPPSEYSAPAAQHLTSGDAAAPTAPPSSSAVNALLQMLKKPSAPPKAMTLEELEARMLGNAQASSAAAEAVGTATAASQVMPPGPPPPPVMLPPQMAPGQQQGLPPGALSRGPPHEPMPSEACYALQKGPPPGPQGPLPHGHVLQGQGMPLLQPSYPPHMQPHMHPPQTPGMYGMPPPHPQLAGPPGPGPFQPPMGGHHGPFLPPHPHMMYNNGGMMLPMGHPQMAHMQHPQGPHGMMPPGGLGPPFGPGSMGPRPMHFPQDPGYLMRPGGNPPGMPAGPMHGMQPRPGQMPFGGPGTGPSQVPSPPLPPLQRALADAPQQYHAPAPPMARPSGPVLGAGPAPRPAQARPQGSGGQPDFGQQFARGALIPGQQTAVALAAAAAAAGRAGGVLHGPGGRLRGKYMTPENIEYVVRSLLHNVASGVPYVEDYYYQAFVHKHVSAPSRQQISPGAFPMAALFVPQALRTPSADQMRVMRLDPSAQVKFVEGVEGLGKIVLSNIRTPKVLMDLSFRGATDAVVKPLPASEDSNAEANSSKGAENAARSARPLEQEPLLAARIMIEDCMNLLLDLDDIDRLAAHLAAAAHAQQRAAAVAAAMPLPGPVAAMAAAGAAAAATTAGGPSSGPYGPDSEAPPSPAELRHRRELFLAGISGAFRLPNLPQGTPSAAAGGIDGDGDADARGADVVGDGVLVRILALSKGRNLVARALLAIATPASFSAFEPKQTAKAGAGASPSSAPGQQPQAKPQPSGEAGHSASEAATDAAKAEATPQEAVANGIEEEAPASPVPAALDTSSPYVLLWGTLRNASTLFWMPDVDDASVKPMLESTARLAAALRDALLRLPTARDVLNAAIAFNAGCQRQPDAQRQGASATDELLPLAPTRTVATSAPGSVAGPPAAWLGEALAALVMRAAQLGLLASTDGGSTPTESAATPASGDGKAEETGTSDAEWGAVFGQLHERVSRHLKALGGAHSMAVASSNAEALAMVRSLCCRQLVNAMLPHASTEQAQQLKDALAAFAA